MEIVVNEWLLEYLRPDSNASEKILALKFINTWVSKCDKVLIRRPSPFVKKFYTFMKHYGADKDFKKRFGKLNELLFHNLDKTIIVDDSDVSPLHERISSIDLKDDKYLVELAYASTDKIIITTDKRLIEKLNNESELKIYLLEEFIKSYSP